MSDDVVIGGKSYISSKSAARATGYAQDYIGQLARSGQIDAQRVGGLWYILPESLEAYKTRSDDFKPQPPVSAPPQDPESVVSFDGKDYISANRAAKITGYNQDYIGQLARSGKILSRQIGNRWYVDRAGLIAHKTEKDSLLAAVQREAVGLRKSESSNVVRVPSEYSPEPVAIQRVTEMKTVAPEGVNDNQLLTYVTESQDLIPQIRDKYTAEEVTAQPIPITIKSARPATQSPASERKREGSRLQLAVKGVSMLTIVVVLSYSFVTLRENEKFAALFDIFDREKDTGAMNVASANATDGIDAALERILSRELVYKRSR